jgi:hypothetical protein
VRALAHEILVMQDGKIGLFEDRFALLTQPLQLDALRAVSSYSCYIGLPGLASRSGVPVSARRRKRAAGAQRSPYC